MHILGGNYMSVNKYYICFIRYLLLVVNSITYGIVLSFVNVDSVIWSLSHYFLLAVFLTSYVSLCSDSAEKKPIIKLSPIIIALAAVFGGFYISTLIPFSIKWCILLATIFLISLIGCFLIHKFKENNSDLNLLKTENNIIAPEEIAEYIIKNDDKKCKSLFTCCSCILFQFFALGIIIFVTTILRHSEKYPELLVKVFFISEIAFILLNAVKFYFYYKIERKNKSNLFFAFETFIQVVSFMLYTYLNRNIFYLSTEHNFLVYLLPAIGCFPFLLSSKKMLSLYTKYNNTVINDKNNDKK